MMIIFEGDLEPEEQTEVIDISNFSGLEVGVIGSWHELVTGFGSTNEYVEPMVVGCTKQTISKAATMVITNTGNEPLHYEVYD